MRHSAIALLGAMGARGASALGGILLSLAIARLSGIEGLGRFAVFLSLLGTLSILTRYGRDTLLVRDVAWAKGRAAPGMPVVLFLHGAKRVLLPTVLFGGVGSALLASGWLGAPFSGTVTLMPVALLLLTGLALVAGYAKGLSRAWLAPAFEIGGVSMLAAIFLALLALYFPALDESVITGAFLAALMVWMFVAAVMIRHDAPRAVGLPALEEDQKAALCAGEMDFTLIALATFQTQAGAFVLAALFLPEADLGLLRAAERLALIVSFPMLAIDPVISPRIVRLARGGDGTELRRLTARAMMISGGIGVPVLLALMIWPERALGLMGSEFSAAAGYLRIMALAQFGAALLGPLVVLLNMSGRERESMWISLGTLVFALGLVPLLCVAFGALGFAFAYSAVIVTRLGLIGMRAVFR